MTGSLARLGQRAAARRKIFQPGEMVAGTSVGRVHLLDLSCSGALVYGDMVPAAGTVVRLACPQPLGVARVVWTRGKRFGVAFATPLTADMLEAVIAQQPMLTATDGPVIR